jgi:hypothetical protein
MGAAWTLGRDERLRRRLIMMVLHTIIGRQTDFVFSRDGCFSKRAKVAGSAGHSRNLDRRAGRISRTNHSSHTPRTDVVVPWATRRFQFADLPSPGEEKREKRREEKRKGEANRARVTPWLSDF